MYFIILLIVILVLIYLHEYLYKEKFVSGYDPNFFNPEPVDYNTRKQDCDELTYTPTECVVDTVVPSNKVVCDKSLSPITNNDIANKKKCKASGEKKNPTLSLKYDFDLLSSFNNSQINNDENNLNEDSNKVYIEDNFGDELETFNDLKTDVRSLNSLENDVMSNY